MDNKVVFRHSIHAYISLSKIPAGIYLFKVSNGNTRTMCEICVLENNVKYVQR